MNENNRGSSRRKHEAPENGFMQTEKTGPVY